MNHCRVSLGTLSGLLLTAALLADEPDSQNALAQPDKAALQVPPVAEPGAPAGKAPRGGRLIKLQFMEGSVVAGRLSIDALTVETRFGKLEIPVASVVSFTPGLDSHPEERKRIARWIQELGSNVAAERDAAQRSLAELGVAVQNELARYVNDEDTERRERVHKLLADLEETEPDDDVDPALARPWIAEDTLETELFTVVGKVSPRTFNVQTQYGQLAVDVNDIRRAQREVDERPEVRKNVAVTGTHLAPANMVSTGVKLARGDKVVITADGRITMSPWGNNAVATPDGSEQYHWFVPGQIPGGALVARIGNGGRVFKVGSKHSFTASKAGVLFLGLGMAPQFASDDYNFPGEYSVKVRVNAR
jgi:hypothetical protein